MYCKTSSQTGRWAPDLEWEVLCLTLSPLDWPLEARYRHGSQVDGQSFGGCCVECVGVLMSMCWCWCEDVLVLMCWCVGVNGWCDVLVLMLLWCVGFLNRLAPRLPDSQYLTLAPILLTSSQYIHYFTSQIKNCLSVLVCWCVGVMCWVLALVRWCVDMLVCWCVGVFMYWCVDVFTRKTNRLGWGPLRATDH